MNDKLIIEAQDQNTNDVSFTFSYINSENQTAASLAGFAKYVNTQLTNNMLQKITWRRDTDITTAA